MIAKVTLDGVDITQRVTVTNITSTGNVAVRWLPDPWNDLVLAAHSLQTACRLYQEAWQ